MALARRPASQEMSIAALCHPLGSREMALPALLSVLRIVSYIEAQHNPGDLPPVCTVCIGIE